jgi:hypothetical protein
MIGGTSHMESFDPKPELNRYAGKTIAGVPYGDPDSPFVAERPRGDRGLHKVHPTIYRCGRVRSTKSELSQRLVAARLLRGRSRRRAS